MFPSIIRESPLLSASIAAVAAILLCVFASAMVSHWRNRRNTGTIRREPVLDRRHPLGVVQYSVSYVTLNDVTKGGDGGIVARKSAGASANFTGHSTIDQTVSEQSPEPPPPTPP